MGKYYYVKMANSTVYCDHNKQYKATATAKEIEKIACEYSLGCYEQDALALLRVKYETHTTIEKGFLGIEHKKTYQQGAPFFIICEDDGQFLVDIVTGNRYEKVKEVPYASREFSRKLKLCPVKEALPGEVVKHLNSLSDSDSVARYINRIADLERAIFLGYQKDMIMLKNDQNQMNSEESYIRSFRNRYGK